MDEKKKTNEQGFAQGENGGRRRRGGKQRHHGHVGAQNMQNAQNVNVQNASSGQLQQKSVKTQEQGGNKQPLAQARMFPFGKRNKPNKPWLNRLHLTNIQLNQTLQERYQPCHHEFQVNLRGDIR